MYALLKDLVLEILRCPKEPPGPPAGSHGSVQVFRAARSYLGYRLLGMWIGLGFFAVLEIAGLIVAVLALGPLGLVVAAALVVFVLGKAAFFYVVTRLDYDMRFYIITDRSLRIREGVLVVREITLTFDNIQNMKIEQGPIQRLFGIYDLVVETAGGGGGGGQSGAQGGQTNLMHRGVFRGLKKPDELRDLILSYLKSVRTTGLGDQDEVREAIREATREPSWPGEPARSPQASGAPTGAQTGVAPASSLAFSRSSLFGPREIDVLHAIRDEVADWRRTIKTGNA